MDKPLKVSTRLVMRRRYFRKGSNDNAAAKRGGGGGRLWKPDRGKVGQEEKKK